MQIKEKKRENIPYLIEKNQKKNIITVLTKVIGTRFTHALQINRILGLPLKKSEKVQQLTKVQKKHYVYALNSLNFTYQDKDREEVTSRAALITIKSYRHWRFKNGLPCRGQRTKTNASTAFHRKRGGPTAKEKTKLFMKNKKKFDKAYKKTKKR